MNEGLSSEAFSAGMESCMLPRTRTSLLRGFVTPSFEKILVGIRTKPPLL